MRTIRIGISNLIVVVAKRRALASPPLPFPSPRSGSAFHRTENLGAGERGQLECYFYPGRRADTLALGYNPSFFQG